MERARRLTERLRRAPTLLVKTELEALLGMLRSDRAARVLLLSLSERVSVGANAGSFARGVPHSHQVGLEFARSPEQRALFGYQVLDGLLGGSPSPQDVAATVVKVGTLYVDVPEEGRSVTPAEAISRFVDVFIDPMIDYLEGAWVLDDMLLALMARYKQRSEWFGRERLLQIARDNAEDSRRDEIEQRLKGDFCGYLFDQGIDFTMEAVSPEHGGKTDVLSARLANGRRLVVEAKVYDGGDRNGTWVKSGIRQAASYANEWSESYAYLLVYNISENTLLEFSGANQKDALWATQALGKEVRIAAINLTDRQPASKASQTRQFIINCLPT